MTVFFNGISAKGIHKLHHAIYSKFIPPPPAPTVMLKLVFLTECYRSTFPTSPYLCDVIHKCPLKVRNCLEQLKITIQCDRVDECNIDNQ